jgi:hypothetical protein
MGGGRGHGIVSVGGQQVRRVVSISGIRDDRVNREMRAEARGVLLENNMDGGGDAEGLRVVDAVAKGVRRVVNHDAPERFFAEFAAQLVGHFGKNGASEDPKFGGVG